VKTYDSDVFEKYQANRLRVIATSTAASNTCGGIFIVPFLPCFASGFHWIVTQVDADDTAYESALMQQCNYRLRWYDTQGRLIEKWCIIEDGTKYIAATRITV